MAERLELTGTRVLIPLEAREMTEILLNGRKILTHLSILINFFMSYAFTVILPSIYTILHTNRALNELVRLVCLISAIHNEYISKL